MGAEWRNEKQSLSRLVKRSPERIAFACTSLGGSDEKTNTNKNIL